MNKLIKCNQTHEDMLLAYLEKEPVRNTFLIGDIINYGFENDIQSIWATLDDHDCTAIYLWFCNNLLIYSHKELLDEHSLAQIIAMKAPDQVMAKRVYLEQILPMLDGYSIKSKRLLAYELDNNDNQQEFAGPSFSYRIAEPKDVDSIYDFLQSGELAPLYRSKSMIENRIATGEGIHLLIEENNQLIAHINSAASTPYSTMIGGLFTHKEYRGNGRAHFLLRCLCQEIMSHHRTPCLITAQGEEHNLFLRSNFIEIEEFTTLEPIRGGAK